MHSVCHFFIYFMCMFVRGISTILENDLFCYLRDVEVICGRTERCSTVKLLSAIYDKFVTNFVDK